MRTIKENKKLIAKYPFLKPSWSEHYDYRYTWADDMPKGWWVAFGEMMCDDIKNELIKYNYLDKFEITQVKEKWGELRLYHNGVPVGCKVEKIIDKYSNLSRNICAACGKPDVPIMNWGWIYPLCEKHATNKDEYQECAEKQEPHKMTNEMKWSQYDKESEKWIDHSVDISDTANKIRRRWEELNAVSTDG